MPRRRQSVRVALLSVAAVVATLVASASADAEEAPPAAAAACGNSASFQEMDGSSSRTDIEWFDLTSECETGILRVGVRLAAAVAPEDLYAFVVPMGTDNIRGDGCQGVDFIMFGFGLEDGTLVARLLELPNCDDTIDRGPVYLAKTPSGFTMEVNRSRLADVGFVEVGAYVEHWLDEPGAGDRYPNDAVQDFQLVDFDLGETMVCDRCFYLSNELRGGIAEREFKYGAEGDTVLVGNWDGIAGDSLGIRRGADYFLHDVIGQFLENSFRFGRPADVTIVGDWNADGTDSLGVRRGNEYFLTNPRRGGIAEIHFGYGRPDDIVHVGDWNGDGISTLMVQRGRTFYQTNRLRGGNAETVFTFGRIGDEVFIGDWNGDGIETLGLRRGNKIFLVNSQRSGNADITFSFGRVDDILVFGDWDGDGIDTPIVLR